VEFLGIAHRQNVPKNTREQKRRYYQKPGHTKRMLSGEGQSLTPSRLLRQFYRL
jgi:hypothetical protein